MRFPIHLDELAWGSHGEGVYHHGRVADAGLPGGIANKYWSEVDVDPQVMREELNKVLVG